MADEKKQKKPRRKGVRLWGALTGVSAVLMAGLLIGTPIAESYSTVINLYLNTPTTEVKKGADSGDTEYYKSAYDSEESMQAEENKVAEQVEAEGAALLKNDNNALPLAKGSKVSTFSASSTNLVYGGTGSGSVDTSTAPTLKSALEDAGLSVNSTLWDYYSSEDVTSNYSRVIPENLIGANTGSATHDYAANEVPWDKVKTAAGDSVSEYGDAAIFVLARSGGEGADLPDGSSAEGEVTSANGLDGDYLALSQEEKDNLAGLKALKDEGKIKKIVVLINSSNAPEVDFLNPEICGVDYGIDAALWIGDPGQIGINAIGDILVGDINPSGSLVDTYCYDNSTSPAIQNAYATEYTNAAEMGLSTNSGSGTGSAAGTSTTYAEGIYVGYKYYETRYEDAVLSQGNAGDYDYDSIVAYPFGTGLSYTTFQMSNYSMTESGDTFKISVDVTNTGSVAGKKTVQIYMQSPYTDYDKTNGVEKASVQLVGYNKSKLLQPGETQTLEITVDKEETAAYDSNGAKTYVVDAGDYYFAAGENAHDALNNILAAKGNTPSSTNGKMDDEGDASLVATWNNAALDTTTYAISEATGTAITNQLDEADPNKSSVSCGTVTWLSRSDWTGTWPERVQYTMTSELKDALADSNYSGSNEGDTMPTLGADNGMTLAMMIGKDYDDSDWDKLLDQLTFDEMANTITLGFHNTAEMQSVSKPATKDENGPQGLTASLVGGGSGMCWSSEDVMAATMNDALIKQMGEFIGEDCLYGGYAGLYGPACNIHRTPYSGRNFEYYSEDAFLSGNICAAEVEGIQSKGIYVYLKHYAFNDAETNRAGVCTWFNEQTAREIYLKPFQTAIVKGGAWNVMNAFNREGAIWSGANKALQTTILRDEWGMRGMSITDFSGMNSYMDVCDGLLAGTDIWDSSMTKIHTTKLAQYKDDPTIVSAMRQAAHRILYTVANSSGMNGMGANDTIVEVTPWWQMILHVGRVLFVVTTVGAIAMLVRAIRRNEPVQPKSSEKTEA